MHLQSCWWSIYLILDIWSYTHSCIHFPISRFVCTKVLLIAWTLPFIRRRHIVMNVYHGTFLCGGWLLMRRRWGLRENTFHFLLPMIICKSFIILISFRSALLQFSLICWSISSSSGSSRITFSFRPILMRLINFNWLGSFIFKEWKWRSFLFAECWRLKSTTTYIWFKSSSFCKLFIILGHTIHIF